MLIHRADKAENWRFSYFCFALQMENKKYKSLPHWALWPFTLHFVSDTAQPPGMILWSLGPSLSLLPPSLATPHVEELIEERTKT